MTGARDDASLALMRLLHLMDAASAGRRSMELDLRARRVVQALGLDGPSPIMAVGERLGVSPSTMTGLADRLERQGYVRRSPHPTDRRAVVLELTESGERLYGEEREFYARLIDETLAPLAATERRLILRALAQVPLEPPTAGGPRSGRGAASRR